MKPLFFIKVRKWIYPYWVISRIALLVLGSLAFLHVEQALRQRRKLEKLAEENLRYVNPSN